MDPETKFLSGLIELQYGQDVEKELAGVANDVSWAKGWPFDDKSFWNAEAFMWSKKVGRESQKLISSELKFLSGRNLDLGCGAFSYVHSVGFDLSQKMLDFNDNCSSKVVGSLEEKLPFDSGSFDSITSVFVLNYVKNYSGLLSEVKRVLIAGGIFVMVLSAKGINDWQRQKQVNDFSSEKWVTELEKVGFSIDCYEKEGLWFFKCLK